MHGIHKDFGRAVYNTLLHAHVSSDLYSIHYSIVVPLMTRGRLQSYFKLFEKWVCEPGGNEIPSSEFASTDYAHDSGFGGLGNRKIVHQVDTGRRGCQSLRLDQMFGGGSEICTVRSVRSRLCPVSFSPPTGSQSLLFPRLHAKRIAKLRKMEQVVGDLLQVYNTDIMCGS